MGAASIGIAVGAGFYIEAAFAVLSVMFVIEVIAPALGKFGPKRLRTKDASIMFLLSDKTKIEELIAYLKSEGMVIENLRIRQLLEADNLIKHELDFRLTTLPRKETSQLYVELSALPYIETVEIEIFP